MTRDMLLPVFNNADPGPAERRRHFRAERPCGWRFPRTRTPWTRSFSRAATSASWPSTAR
ncbi:MAG: hypothetical protein MZV70_11930 [Desulfobacterales bacterium]|nr:hypothetical protein [Desulfobacterales bacterium]